MKQAGDSAKMGTGVGTRVGRVVWELRVLWTTALLLLVCDIVLRPYVFEGKPNSLEALRLHARSPGPAQVVLIGSSRFRRVAPADVHAVAPDVNLANLAFNGGTLAADNALIQRYLPPETLRAGGTRLVVIGTGVLDFNDGYRNPVAVPDTWGWTDFFAHIIERGTDAETRLFLFEQPPVRWSSLLQGYRRNKLRGEVRALGLQLTGRMQAPKKKKDRSPGDDVLENAQAQKANGAVSLDQVPQPLSSAYLRRFAVGGRQVKALGELVVYLQANQVAVALVDGPVSDWYAGVYRHGEAVAYHKTMITVGRALDIPVFILPKAAYGLVDADYFRPDGRFDGHHIVGAAARVNFAEGLARHVITPLISRIEAGEVIGFEQSRFEQSRFDPDGVEP